MKKLLLLFVAVLFLGFTGNAQVSGKWRIKADMEQNEIATGDFKTYGIEFISSDANTFTAQYYDINNDSKFTGEIYSSKVTKIVQQDPNGYFAVYIGYFVSRTKIKGTWMDVHGNTGDFEWVKK